MQCYFFLIRFLIFVQTVSRNSLISSSIVLCGSSLSGRFSGLGLLTSASTKTNTSTAISPPICYSFVLYPSAGSSSHRASRRSRNLDMGSSHILQTGCRSVAHIPSAPRLALDNCERSEYLSEQIHNQAQRFASPFSSPSPPLSAQKRPGASIETLGPQSMVCPDSIFSSNSFWLD